MKGNFDYDFFNYYFSVFWIQCAGDRKLNLRRISLVTTPRNIQVKIQKC